MLSHEILDGDTTFSFSENDVSILLDVIRHLRNDGIDTLENDEVELIDDLLTALDEGDRILIGG